MSDRPRRRLAAIVAADVVGYSRLIGLDEEGTLAVLRDIRRDIVDPLLTEHSGRIANTAGDSLLIEFSSVVDAVRCAAAMQRAVGEHGAGMPEERRLAFRVGINIGDVVSEGNDLLGDGVNVAARLESIAEAGGITLSDDAYRQVRDRIDMAWHDAGEHVLKNIARPVRVWAWSAGTAEADDCAQPPSGPAPDRPSIAVLPFDNISGDPEQGYFADGITEDIITEISRFPELLVIARNSTFTYKGRATKVQDICRELDVRYVLEGSVRRSGQRVRVTAQLIDGRSGGHVWAERYDREMADVFAVQDDVTSEIVRALEINLIDRDRTASRSEPKNPEAYDCVLRGREQYRLFTRAGNEAAQKLYERAIALDPDYAEPYAGLAETCVHQWFMGTEATLERAFELAQAAAARDPLLPLVQEALSTVHLFSRRHAEAIETAQRWVDLEPGSADAYANLAGVMHFSGNNDRVIDLIAKAMRLNPHYPFFYLHYIGLAKFGMRRFDEAATAFNRAVSRNPEDLWPHVLLAATYGHLNDRARAGAEMAEVLRINPQFSTASLLRLMPYRRDSEVELLIDGLREAGLAEETGHDPA